MPNCRGRYDVSIPTFYTTKQGRVGAPKFNRPNSIKGIKGDRHPPWTNWVDLSTWGVQSPFSLFFLQIVERFLLSHLLPLACYQWR